MPQQVDKVEGEEPVGPQILEFYLSYLHNEPGHLPIEAKEALRLCCKKFKYFFDASIDDASVWNGDAGYFHTEFKGKIIMFEVKIFGTSDAIPESFKSLDILYQMLPSLKALNVRMPTANALNAVLPESIGQLTRLTKLRVDMASALSLPASFSKLTLLKSLSLETSPTSFQVLHPLMGCKALVDLNIRVSGSELIRLADVLLNFPKLKSVDAFGIGSDASALSENIGCLQLTRLVLSIQKIASLPESLGDISSLTYLHLGAEEGLENLPASLGNLTGLTELSLNCKGLTALPDSIGQLKHLNCFHLNCTYLSTLPCSIGELESLMELRITECNALTTLPENVGNLKSLRILAFFECESLLTLPNSIKCLELHELMIADCDQLVEPSVETLWQQYGTALYYHSKKRGLTISHGRLR